jgi:hypothetical protein
MSPVMVFTSLIVRSATLFSSAWTGAEMEMRREARSIAIDFVIERTRLP